MLEAISDEIIKNEQNLQACRNLNTVLRSKVTKKWSVSAEIMCRSIVELE